MRMRRMFQGLELFSTVQYFMIFSMVVTVIGIIAVAFYFALPSMVVLPPFLAHVMFGQAGLLLLL